MSAAEGTGPLPVMLGGMVKDKIAEVLASAGVWERHLLVAVSGGRDSMLLLSFLRALASEHGFSLSVAHVHHGLRGAEADEDARFVAAAAREGGLAFFERRVDPARLRNEAPNSRLRPTIEEAARALRRAALLEMAEEAGADRIALAHHAGDQAETVLLRILRGTGLDGLAAMAPVSPDGRWIRPLLSIRPDQMTEAARQRGVRWREDASNRDRRFARNRLRHDWLPGLSEAFGTDLLRNLTHLADAVGADLEWIEEQVGLAARERIEVGPEGIRLALEGWDVLPEALARRLVRRALRAAGLERAVSSAHLQRVLAFLRRGRGAGRDRRIELPLGAVLRRAEGAFLLQFPETAGSNARRLPAVGNATVPRRE
jgi:tRNA(Ile)-lysidine synthase